MPISSIGAPSAVLMNGNGHRQQERHGQDRAEHQQALLADVTEQLAQRDLVAGHGASRCVEGRGEADLGIAELDGRHQAGSGTDGKPDNAMASSRSS